VLFVVLFVAVTVMLPEIVSAFEGESIETFPLVTTVTPVKVVELFMVKESGVTANGMIMVLASVPLVPVTVTKYSPEVVVEVVEIVSMEAFDTAFVTKIWD
jgi:hypothetical protein